MAQHRDFGRGGPDVVIARAQSARRHLEHFANGYGLTARLPFQELTGVS
jgi:hypothetical protein